MEGGFTTYQFSGKAERRSRDLSLFRVLRREAEKVGGGDARREHRFARCCEILDGGGIGSARPESGLTALVVEPLAQPLQCSCACEPREGLSYGCER